MFDVSDNFIEELAKASSQSLTEKLREMALLVGWPADAVDALSVVEEDGDLQIKIDDEMRQTVDELEYGTHEHVPSPVLRRFKADLPRLLEPFIIDMFSSKSDELVNAI